MSLKWADDIVYQAIGYSVTFRYIEETIYISDNIWVTLSSSFCMDSGDSYFKIGFNPFDFLPTISFDIFDIKPTAREIGLKLKGIIEDGSVCINSSFDTITIGINIKQLKDEDYTFSGSIEITIKLPERRDDEENEASEKNEQERRDLENLQKAFGIGALAVGAIVLGKIIKGGIGALVGGPIGAAIGLAT